MTPQKRNKIIVLSATILLILIIVVLYFNQNYGSEYSILQSKCSIPSSRTFAVCKEENGKIVPIQLSLSPNKNIPQYEDYFVKEGDKIVINLDLSDILTSKNYKEINTDLDKKLSLCLYSAFDLSSFKIYSQNNFRLIDNNFLCFSSFYKNQNSPRFILEGYAPSVNIDSFPFTLDIYKMPPNLEIATMDTVSPEYITNSNFIIKLSLFRISK